MKILISTHHQEENNKDATAACSSLPPIPKTILPHYIILNKTVSMFKSLLLSFFFLTSFLNAQGITDGGQIASDESNCGAFNPAAIVNVLSASGESDCSTNESCCIDDFKPAELTLQYTGQDCTATSTSQPADKWSCEGDPSYDNEVYIIANDDSEPDRGEIWFNGPVSLGSNFIVDANNAGATKLKANTYIHIFDEEGGTIIQTIQFHTSCSQPLSAGDQWGSVKLLSIVSEDDRTCGSDNDEGILYQWQNSSNGISNWVNIEGATSDGYDPGMIYSTTYYRRMAIDCYNDTQVPSNIVTKTVHPEVVASAGPDQTICFGESTFLTGSVNSGNFEGFILKAEPEDESEKITFESKETSSSNAPRLLLYLDGSSTPVTLYSTKDARIESGKLDHNHSHDEIKIGFDGKNEHVRGLVGFDVSSVAGTVTQAYLVLNAVKSGNLKIGVYALNENWIEDEVTYTERQLSVDWSTLGGLNPGQPMLDAINVSSVGDYMWDVTDAFVGSSGSYTYFWDNGLGFGKTKTVSPHHTTTYTLTVNNEFGCSASDQVTVTVLPGIDGGEIGYNEDKCGPYDPEEIINITSAEVNNCFDEESCCTDGFKPAVLTMKYTGEDCSASVTSQPSDKWDCDGDPEYDDLVYIVANDDSNPDRGHIWFSGNVTLNNNFIIDAGNAGEPKLKSSTFLHIFNEQNGEIIQSIEFHTSCSQPLSTGDQWGSAKLLKIISEEGQTCGSEGSETTGYQWQYRLGTAGTWINIPGATGESYDPGMITETTQYRRVVNDCICEQKHSNIITKSVNCSAIGDFVWMDVNTNNLQDPGEKGINGILVKLYEEDGTFVDSELTHASSSSRESGNTRAETDGQYKFTNLDAGTYYLTFEYPDTLQMCECDHGIDDSIDSDLSTSGIPLVGKTANYTLAPGEENMTVDGGFFYAVLPVVLSEFTATVKGESVHLKWSTVSEINNRGFYIERTTTDHGNFIELAYVDGAGNSDKKIDYDYVDIPSISSSIYYYRLKQEDYDGNIFYSETVKALLKGLKEFVVFPNPTSGNVTMILPENHHYDQAQLIDPLGRVLLQIPLSDITSRYNMDISRLSSGIYIVKLLNKSKSISKRIILNK